MPSNDHPTVSVAMAVLAPDPRYFPAAVRSILDQTIEDLELVIVEDPSERSAAEQLRGIDDPRVRLIENPIRTSLVDQRNRAVSEGRAHLVAILDADDVARPEWLAAQVRMFEDRPEVDVVGTALRVVDDAGDVVGYRDYPTDHEDIVRAFPRYNPVAQPGVVFRRDAFDATGGYQARIANEDYDLWSRMALAGRVFANHDRRLVDYRVHPSGMKARKLRETIRGTLDVKWRLWRSHLGAIGWLWFAMEAALLLLPTDLVYRAFVRLRYRRDGT